MNPSIRWKRNYGLLARNVNNVEIATCSSINSSAVFISQREGEYRNIDFSEKYTSLDENGIYYKNVLVASQVSSFHPANRTALFFTKGKQELRFTGDGTSFTPFTKEKIGEFCEVHALSNVSDFWHDEGMLACIKDGTLRILSDENKKYYPEFVKLGVKNVKDLRVAGRNVGILKKDGSLWVWGQKRSGKDGRKKKFTMTPWCIGKSVQSFSMSPSGVYNSILLFVKDNRAYGRSSARRFALPKKSKNNWHNDRPVLLKQNIKQVYTGADITLLLDLNGNLYWWGCVEMYLIELGGKAS